MPPQGPTGVRTTRRPLRPFFYEAVHGYSSICNFLKSAFGIRGLCRAFVLQASSPPWVSFLLIYRCLWAQRSCSSLGIDYFSAQFEPLCPG